MDTRKQTFIKKATLVIAIVAIIAIVAVVAITQLVGMDNKKGPVGDIEFTELGYTPTEYVASPGSLSEHRTSLYNDGAWDGTQMPVGNYPVSTLEDLIALADIMAHQSVEGSVFYLTADLVLDKDNQTNRVAIGSGDDTSSCFDGTFDGCGFAIENLTGESLFGAVSPTGVVKNFTLKNAEITALAALVGVVNFGEIERVAVVGGTVTSGSDVAGFVNQNCGVIKNSYIKDAQLKSTGDQRSENAFANSAFPDASLSSCFAADLKNADDEEIISLVGGIDNGTATLNNSYVVSGTTTNISAGIISVKDAASGKLAVLLGDAFGQDFVDDSGAPKDSLPVFLLTRELDTHKVNTVTASFELDTTIVITVYCNNGYTLDVEAFEGSGFPDFVDCALMLDNKTFAWNTPITGDTNLLIRDYIDFSANGQGTPETPLTVSNLDDINKLAWAFSNENIHILGAGDSYFLPLVDYICVQLGADITFGNTFVQNAVLGEVLSVSDTVEQTTSEYLYDSVNDAWYLATNTSEKISDADLITRLNNLVVKWQPMDFYGEFNGGNYAINNLFVKSNADNAGFFGKFYGTVKNLTINGYVQGKNNIAGVIGSCDSTVYTLLDNAVIENVVNNATVVGANNVGGIIGNNASKAVTILNSTNNGAISSSAANAKIGGFVGTTANSNLTITNSKNDGYVTSGYSAGNVGGFIGYIDGTGTINISGSINEGILEHTGKGDLSIGGFIGQIALTTGTVNITDCTNGNEQNANAGEVKSSNANAGGFIGKVGAGTAIISGSTNYATISTAESNSAGFVGTLDAAATIAISDSQNHGDVSARSNAAGFIGNNKSKATITDSTNTGTISIATYNAGNVAGFVARHADADLTIKNSTNDGDVSTTNAGCDVGGFLGFVTGYGNIIINDSINNGQINAGTAMDTRWLGLAGGIIADVNNFDGEVTINNVENCGTISAPKASGGIIGKIHSNTLNIYNALNYGTIVSTGDSGTKTDAPVAGGIVGWIYLQADRNMVTNICNSANMGMISIRPAKDGLSDSYAGGIVGCVEKSNSGYQSNFKGDNLLNLGTILNEANAENVAEMIGSTIASTTITNAFGAEGKLCVASGTLTDDSTYTNYTVKADATGYAVLDTNGSPVDLFVRLNNNNNFNYHYWTMSENAIEFEEKKATIVFWNGIEIVINVDGKKTIADIDVRDIPLQPYKKIIGWILPDGTEFSINDKTLLVREATYTAVYAPMFEGEGTETNPYLIKNADDLRNLSKLVNEGLSTAGAYYKQTADITVADYTLSVVDGGLYLVVEINKVQYYNMLDSHNIYKYVGGTFTQIDGAEHTQVSSVIFPMYTNRVHSIGTATHSFKGVFDGDQHTIKGLIYMSGDQYVGLFGQAESSIFKNINIDNVYLKAGCDDAGTIVACAKDSQISNCTAKNVVAWLSAHEFGGIIGSAENSSVFDCRVNDLEINGTGHSFGGVIGSAKNSIVNNCSANNIFANIGGITNFGGIVSYAITSAVSNCSVNDLQLQNSSIQYIGGITGQAVGVTINNCHVNEMKAINSQSQYFGGLVGKLSDVTVADSTVKNLEADLYVIGENGYVGGVIGSAYGYDVAIIDCTVEGLNFEIFTSDEQYNIYIGGIVAYAEAWNFVIEGTSVIGATVIAFAYDAAVNFGGVIGYAYENNIRIKNSFADASTDLSYAEIHECGGLVGYASCNPSIAIENSYAILEITNATDDAYIGGLVSTLDAYSSIIKNSYANLTIIGDFAESQVGGLFADLYTSDAILENCFASSNFALEFCGWDAGNNDFSDCANFVVDGSATGGYSVVGNDATTSLLTALNNVAIANSSYNLWTVGEDGATPTLRTVTKEIGFVDNNGNAIGTYTGIDGKVYIVGSGDVYYTLDGSIPALSSNTTYLYGVGGIVVESGTTVNAIVLDSHGNPQSKMLSATFSGTQVVITFDGGTTLVGVAPDSIICGVGDVVELPLNLKSTNGATLIGWTTSSNGDASKIVGAFFYAVLPESGNAITLYPVWDDSGRSVWDGTTVSETVSYAVTKETIEYEINSAADFAGVAEMIRKNSFPDSHADKVVILNINVDIDLNNHAWTPIDRSDSSFYFAVAVNGNGHTLYNLFVPDGAQNGGLFGRFWNLFVDSLNVVGATVYGEKAAGTLLAGGAQNGVITNTTVQNVTIFGGKGSHVGGIVGEFYNGALSLGNNAVICATLNGGLYAGGLLGFSINSYENNLSHVLFENNFALVAFDDTATTGLAIGKVIGMTIDIRETYASGNFDFIGESSEVRIKTYEVTKLELATDGYRTANMTKDSLLALMNHGVRAMGNGFMTWEMSAGGVPVINYALAVGDIDTSETFTDPEEFEEETAFDWYYKHIDEDVYYIGTAEEFAAFAALSNISGIDFAGKTIVLTANIDITDFNLSPIGAGGDSNKFFRGTFDGAEYTISGIKNTLFGTVANVATIKNLTVRGNIRNSDYMSAINGHYGSAAIAISLRGTISNCVSYVNIKFESEEPAYIFIGGLVGVSEGGTIKNCANFGTIYGDCQSYIGGILANATHKTVIDNCQNYGNVTGNGTTYIGGIVGYAQTHANYPDTETVIKNSDNHGDVIRKGSNPANVGGIIGTAGYKVVIDNCNNYGDVLGDAGYNCYIGGVAGYVVKGVSIQNCANEGKIVGETTNFNYDLYVGGVVGYAEDNVVIKNCNNSGDVTTTRVADNVVIGGIVGYLSKGGSIANSNNEGTITAGNAVRIYIGGIVGYAATEVTIENCDNDGAVTATPNSAPGSLKYYIYLGGIAGYANGDVAIKNSDNSGDIKGYHTDYLFVGGILGCSGYEDGNVSIEKCNNSGNIASANAAFFKIGGIVGQSAGVTLYKCINEGEIMVYVTGRVDDGDNVRVGGLVGAAYGDGRTAMTLIESSINYGDVSVALDGPIMGCGVGGLVGTGAALIINNSVNIGAITCDRGYVGGLLGYADYDIDNQYARMYNCVNFGKTTRMALVGNEANNGYDKFDCLEVVNCAILAGTGDLSGTSTCFVFVADSTVAGGYRITGGNLSLLTFLNSNAFNSRVEGRMAWALVDGTLVPSAEFTTFDVTTELSGALTVNDNSAVGKDAASDLAIYVLKFDVGTGNKYPSTLTVEIAGAVLDASNYDWNATNGVLTIFAGAITGDIKVIASSELIEYTTSTEVNEGGIVSVDAANEKYGSTITVNCTPDLGYKLVKVEYSVDPDDDDSWTEIVADENGHYSFKLLCDTKVKATFEKITYNLTVIIDGEETNREAVIGESVDLDAKGEDFPVVGVEQTAIKSLYYIYNGVRHNLIGGVATATNYTFIMPAGDVKLYIDYVYESKITTETVISNEDGLVKPANSEDNTITVTESAKNGDLITISANIAKGFKFKNIKIFDANSNALEPLAIINSVTGEFKMPVAPIRIELEVEIETYTLELDLGSLGWTDGYIDDIFNVTYTYGQSVSFGVDTAVHRDGTFVAFLNTLSNSGLSAIMKGVGGEGDKVTYVMYNFTMPAENATIRIEAITDGSVPIVAEPTINDVVFDGAIKVYDYTNDELGNEIHELNSEITQIFVVGNVNGFHINSFSVDGGHFTTPLEAVAIHQLVIGGTTVYGAVFDTADWTSNNGYTIKVGTISGSVTFEGDVAGYTVSVGDEADASSVLSGDLLDAGEKLTIIPNLQKGYKVGFAAYRVSGGSNWVMLQAQEDGTYILDSMPAMNITIQVLIVEDTHDITVVVSNQGEGTVEVAASAKQDDTVTLTVTPNVGYKLASIKYVTVTNPEGITLDADTYVFTMPNEAVTVTVTFEKILHTVDLEIDDEFGDNIILTVDPSEVIDGESASLATASYEDRVYILIEAGYKAGISVTLVSDPTKTVSLQQRSDGKYYFVMPNEPVNVTVIAEKIEYTIASEITNGKGEVEFFKEDDDGKWISVGSDTIAYVGDVLRAEFHANLGYGIADWSVNGNVTISSQDKNFVVFTVNADNVVCQAMFAANTYRLTVNNANKYRIITSYTATCDEIVEVNVNVMNGYQVTRLYYTVNGIEHDIEFRIEGSTFRMPAGNATLGAEVEPIKYTVTFDVGEDATEMSPITLTIESPTTYLRSAKRVGYMFKFWEVVKSEDLKYEEGYIFPQADTLTGICGNITFKAIWVKCAHQFETVTVDPTCTTQGYTMHTCPDCGEIKTTYTDALGHDYEIVVETPATCTTAGSTSKHCKRCESVIDITVIDALGHTFEFTSTVPPSVENKTDGYDLYTCVHGDATEQRNIVKYETLIPPVLTTNVEGVSLNDYVPGTELPVPEVKGYVFEGWYTSPTYQGEAITSLDNIDADTVLYAKMSAKGGISGGGAAGIAIGCVVLVLIAAFIALYLVEKKKGPVMSKVFGKVDQLVEKVATKIKKKDESDSSDSADSEQKSETPNSAEDTSKTESDTDDNKND